MSYNGGLTREQFLVNEARIVAHFLLEDKSDEMITESIYKDNLFQYPTEHMTRNITGICIKRLRILDNTNPVIEKIKFEISVLFSGDFDC